MLECLSHSIVYDLEGAVREAQNNTVKHTLMGMSRADSSFPSLRIQKHGNILKLLVALEAFQRLYPV